MLGQLVLFAQTDSDYYRFHSFLPGNELSDENARKIYQDSNGLIWLAFDSKGLCQYDGSNIETFSHESTDPTSISSNFINDIIEDADGHLWLATNKGLNIFDPQTATFVLPGETDHSVSMNALYRQNDSTFWVGTESGLLKFFKSGDRIEPIKDALTGKLSQSKITKIIYQQDQGYWIGTRNGLYLFSEDFSSKGYWSSSDDKYSLSENEIIDMALLSDRQLLIGTDNAVSVFEFDKEQFRTIEFRDSEIFNYGKVGIIKTFVDSKGRVWIGTTTYGVITGTMIYDSYGAPIEINIPKKILGIDSQYIMDIYEDATGQLLVATKFGGIVSHDPRQHNFPHFRLEDSQWDVGRSSQSFVVSAAQTDAGQLFIGTRERGLVLYNLKDHSHRQIPVYKGIIELRRIEFIYSENDRDLWLCHKHGLNRLDVKTLKSKHYRFHKISSFVKDPDGDFWAGSSNGLYRFNSSTAKFYKHPSRHSEFFDNASIRVFKILSEPNGVYWFGTDGDGLFEYHLKNDSLIQHHHSVTRPKGISGNKIRSILRDQSGQLWVGTKSSGLNRYSGNGEFFKLSKQNGLPSNSVFSIVEDDHNNLWLGSNNGLGRLNSQTLTIDNFNKKHGLQDNVFERYSAFKLNDSRIFMGGNNGFNLFNPASITLDTSVAPLIISRLSANGRTKTIDIFQETSLSFDHSENNITIDFSALDYRDPKAVKYKYRMSGVDEDWVESGNRNYVTYSSLAPGDYSFEFTSTNADGKWSGETLKANIEICRPPWLTWWAKTVYAFIILGLCYLIYRIAMVRAGFIHELKDAEVELEKNKELNQLKLRFFTNISHEFRTPLALILAPLEKLRQDLSIDLKVLRVVNMAYKSAQQLEHLTDQLMYFRKAEQGKLSLKVNHGDLTAFVQEISKPFESLAEKKKIDFVLTPEKKNFSAWFDHDKVSKIVNNLLFNAFKFTPDGGRIEIILKSVNLDSNHEWASLSVIDSGEGIDESVLENIWDRFYQADDVKHGTGIGLELVKTLTEIHKGQVSVQSKKGEGSTFSISIPVEKGVYQNEEITSVSPNLKDDSSAFLIDTELAPEPTEAKVDRKDKKLLIIDDNEIMLDFLQSTFSNEFDVITANDGKEALEILQKTIPDLVLSDVMMPGLTGLELCDAIKTDVLTSHIPVVLLTARVLGEQQIEGFESGADAYVTKPFDVNVLRARLHAILENREKIIASLGGKSTFDPAKISENSLDKEFISQLLTIIEDNFQNVHFSVEEFANDLAMSRSQLFRKLKSLTGKTPSEYLYSFRIQKSVELLKEQEYNISEIAYKTGFSSPNSFTKTFTKHIGTSPTKFMHTMETSRS